MPQLGDFVSNRLPRSFVEPWDSFLRELLASSRGALGDAWLDTYLNAPIWRFALGAGLAGPNPVIGTLMPSVDRVGRYFPLTIALVMPRASIATIEDPWFEKAEMLSLETLSDEFDPVTFSARLEELGWPDCNSEAEACSDGCWWTLGASMLPPLGFRAPALPRGEASTTLLDGNWERWRWNVQPIPFKPDLDKNCYPAEAEND